MVSDILTEAITVAKQRIERSEAAYEGNASAPEDWNQRPEGFLSIYSDVSWLRCSRSYRWDQV